MANPNLKDDKWEEKAMKYGGGGIDDDFYFPNLIIRNMRAAKTKEQQSAPRHFWNFHSGRKSVEIDHDTMGHSSLGSKEKTPQEAALKATLDDTWAKTL